MPKYGKLPFTGAGITIGALVIDELRLVAAAAGLLLLGAPLVRRSITPRTNQTRCPQEGRSRRSWEQEGPVAVAAQEAAGLGRQGGRGLPAAPLAGNVAAALVRGVAHLRGHGGGWRLGRGRRLGRG